MKQKIQWLDGNSPDVYYRIGFNGVTEIRETIEQTSMCFVYRIYKGEHLHSRVMGVVEIGYFPPEQDDE